jgi:ribosomal protein S18 acetylase RimI-like enzyme
VIYLEIRKASKQDIEGIAKVYVDGWKTTYQGLVSDQYLDELSYKKAEKRWNAFLDNENEPFMYVAMNSEGKIVGFASGRSIEEKHFTGELYALYLLQDCRGLGVGKQLVSAVARHFKESGIHSILVWVMEKNKVGTGFYKRMGGTEYIRRTSTFGETVVDDVAYGWNDISLLYDGEHNKVN